MSIESLRKRRYELVPQMREYDLLGQVVAPYLTLTSPPLHRSAVVNTDAFGFRHTIASGATVDTGSASPKDIALGGSFTFGVGAATDAGTLVSALAERTGSRWLNLGIRAGNSTQELIAALPFLLEADRIVVASGLNDLVVALQSGGTNELYGPFFGEDAFANVTSWRLEVLEGIATNPIASVPATHLARELGERIIHRVGVRRRPARASSTVSHAGRHEQAAERALARQHRDLEVLKRTAPVGARLIFAAQPYLETMGREWAPEERELAVLTDELQRAQWERLKGDLIELWPDYVERLRKVCSDLGIVFVDLNAAEFPGWTFVDRVHLNDRGYGLACDLIALALD